MIAQNGAILEILHALFGLVKSPLGTTALQVMSRVILISTVANVPTAQAHWISQWMIGAWALVEVVRYPYYVLGLLGVSVPFILTWIRYSIFLFDYPAGVAGELGTLYVSMPYLRERVGEWAFYATIVAMLTYLWGLPKMYMFMLSQRKKYLSGDAHATKKTKKSQ
jgi:very-long-chain (3R)-3-hydroxyacyl-CoA dehydratase